MKNLSTLAAEILASMPPETRFGDADAALIRRHNTLLSSLENGIAKGFYDSLYAHPHTAEILKNEARDKRESVLRNWWQKTVNGTFDNQYWEWQAFVGLIHIKQKVTTTMVLAMWGWLLKTLRSALKSELPPEELEALMGAFEKLAVTIQALTADSFLANYMQAIEGLSGFNNKLVTRMVALQIDGMIEKAVDRHDFSTARLADEDQIYVHEAKSIH